jgi:excisionase family DNA binding protein
MAHTLEDDRLLTPAEAAALLRVDPQALARWAKAGKIAYGRTGGGHRRYWLSDCQAMAAAQPAPAREAG